MSISWNQIEKDLKADGSLRDIYFFDSTVEIWNSFIAAVLNSEFNFNFYKDGEACEIYTDFSNIFKERENTSLMLSVEKGGVSFNCHFFTEDEIELDISPKEVNGQPSLNIVLEFMAYFSKAIGLPCVLTYENMPQHVIIKFSNEVGSVPMAVT